jgi:hypothetical protein
LNVIGKVEGSSPDAMVDNLATAVKEYYSPNSNNAQEGVNLYHHLLLSEHSDSISSNALPPEVVEALRHGGGGGGVHLYDAYHDIQNPVIHATTANPFALFWNTLFNPVVPNAPPLQQAQGHGGPEGTAWLQDVLTFLNQQLVPETNDLEEEEEQQQGN